jgi:succinyl-CoA synthetase beta subunit
MPHPNGAKQISFKVPVAVRLKRPNAEAGREIFENAAGQLPTLQAATDLGDPSRKACGTVA